MIWRAPVWLFMMLLCVLAAYPRHGLVRSSEQQPVPETRQSSRTGGILNTHPFVDDTVSGLGGEPPALLRTLKATATDLTTVTQPLELQEAVRGGAPHIQVEDHLDLSTLEIDSIDGNLHEFLAVSSGTVKTIRGNCATTPTIPGLPSPALLPLLPLQCLLVADADVLRLGRGSNMWLDNLYLRARRDDRNRDPGFLIFISSTQQTNLWMTRVTVQGDVDGQALKMSGSLYAEGCTFANLGVAVDALRIRWGAALTTAVFMDCNFFDNTLEDYSFLVYASFSSVLLRRPLLGGNVASPGLALFGIHEGAEIFVEGAAIEVYDGESKEILELDGTTPISSAQENLFLCGTNEWFLTVQEEVAALSGSLAIPPTAGACRESTNTSSNVGLIAGVIGGLVALVAAIAAAAFIFKKRRNQSRAAVGGTVEAQASQVKASGENATGAVDLNRSHATASLPPGYSPTGTALGTTSEMDRSTQPALLQESVHTMATVTTGSRTVGSGQILPSTTLGTTEAAQQHDPSSAQHEAVPAGAVSIPGTQADASMSMAATPPSHGENRALVSLPTALVDTFEPEPLPDREPPLPNAQTAEHMEYLHYQLDVSEGEDLLPGLLILPGMASRFQGGQAIVQLARDIRRNAEFAVKFFVSRRAFQDETALYMDSGNPLGRFLPELRMIVDGLSNQLLDRQGRPFPPCIIMEKGESLDMWSQCNKDVDIFAVMQVIHNIAERLLSMHDCGYVHRDLKQSNIMWLPRTKRWTLIDFGCAAKVGEKAPLSFSLPYAAPEIIRAVKAGQRTIIADTAMDAWALGVVAVELFSNRVALNVLEGKDVVMQRILGELPLPWETGAPGATAVLRSMGRLQQAVLALLQRDPAARIDMATFVKRCRGIFAQSTTATHDTSSTS